MSLLLRGLDCFANLVGIGCSGGNVEVGLGAMFMSNASPFLRNDSDIFGVS